jgi:signal transduction histidine kinase
LNSSARIFAIVMGGGLLTALIATALTSFLMRRLGRIARNADALRLGNATAFSPPPGRDEIARIGKSLAALFNGLQTSNAELSALNRELDQRVEERTREVQRLFEETKNAAVTRERLRMSRDLHDTLAHSMLAVLSQIRMVRKVEKAKPELLTDELAEAERVAQEGLDIARSAVGQLRYVAVRDDGLGPALERLLKRLQERAVIEINLDIDPNLSGMSNQTAETLHRIAEEALHNIEKHAKAEHASIEVKLIPGANGMKDSIHLTIVDDGVGFDPSVKKPGHFGLVGLREQAQLIGGTIEIASKPGGGTRLNLDVPV